MIEKIDKGGGRKGKKKKIPSTCGKSLLLIGSRSVLTFVVKFFLLLLLGKS